jgi:polysaccharide chain length determinant protein (PEP-CTERM system associated)
MNELWQQLTSMLRGMWQRRWIGLATAWIVAIIGAAVVFKIPERYEATARVYVDTESLLKPLMAGISIQPNIDQQIALISRTLISRPNVEKLVRMADLDLNVRSEAERDALIDSVTKRINLTSSRATNLYLLRYQDTSPAKAAQVVQSLLTIFIESSLGDKRQDTQTAIRFVDEQVKNYEKLLQQSEDRLKEFRLKYMGVSDRRDGDYFARLGQVQSETDAARLELDAAVQARDAYKRELAGETPVLMPETTQDDASPELDARIAAQRSHLDDLLLRYTDQHPDVVGTKRLLDQLEAQRRDEIEKRRSAAAASPRSGNTADAGPVFQQLRIALAESEARVAAAQAKVSGLEANYAQLRSRARLVPQVEAEFAQLNRDYDVQKKNYEHLVARRDAAAIGVDVQNTGGTEFRVIDPPRVDPTPVMPNRLALLGIVCGVALLVGIIASFLANQLRPTIQDARTLREVTHRPVLGMVSLIPSTGLALRRRRNSILFAGGVGTLFVSFIAVFAFALLVGRVA